MSLSELLFIIIFGSILIFLVCRELICWYFKLTKIVGLLEQLNKKCDEFLKNK